MTNQLPQSIRFQDTDIQIIDRNGVPWISGAQIATALGYVNRDEVSRIYNRNKDEFTTDMSCTANLAVQGKGRVRLFSPRGAHLIAMFARTNRAKAFRRWVLDVLDACSGVSSHNPALEGHAVVIIDGEPVHIDTMAHTSAGDRCVVLDPVSGRCEVRRIIGVEKKRRAFIPYNSGVNPGIPERAEVRVVGKVMEVH